MKLKKNKKEPPSLRILGVSCGGEGRAKKGTAVGESEVESKGNANCSAEGKGKGKGNLKL